MKQQQHIVQDQAGAQYAGGLHSIWAQWEPALLDVEAALADPDCLELTGLDSPVCELLQRAQYRAHTTAELAVGLQPPLPAIDAHHYLLNTMSHAREVLGTLALSTELHELDEELAELGLRSIGATREAFQVARSSSAAAMHYRETMRPIYVEQTSGEHRGMGVLLWSLVAVCAALFAVLLVQVLSVTA